MLTRVRREGWIIFVLFATIIALLMVGYFLRRGNDHGYRIMSDERPLSVVANSCGQSTEGSIIGGVGKGVFHMGCDGELAVLVHYQDHDVKCQVGYITFDEEPKNWNFTVSRRVCILETMSRSGQIQRS